MHRITAIVLVIGFLTLAVFGFAAMGHGEGHSRNVCVAAASQAAPCPEEGSVAWAFFHVAAFKGFSTALVSASVLAALLVLAALIVRAGSYVSAIAPGGFAIAGAVARDALDSIVVSRRRITSWLAIFEKRAPSAFLRAQAPGGIVVSG